MGYKEHGQPVLCCVLALQPFGFRKNPSDYAFLLRLLQAARQCLPQSSSTHVQALTFIEVTTFLYGYAYFHPISLQHEH